MYPVQTLKTLKAELFGGIRNWKKDFVQNVVVNFKQMLLFALLVVTQ